MKKKKRPRGHPPFIPTNDMRRQVQGMAGFGITQDDIADLILNPSTGKPINPKTLREKFPSEIKTGKTVMVTTVANSLYNKALGRGAQSVTACIFILKTRAGWKDRVDVHHTGLTENVAERLAKAIAAKSHKK